MNATQLRLSLLVVVLHWILQICFDVSYVVVVVVVVVEAVVVVVAVVVFVSQ